MTINSKETNFSSVVWYICHLSETLLEKGNDNPIKILFLRGPNTAYACGALSLLQYSITSQQLFVKTLNVSFLK